MIALKPLKKLRGVGGALKGLSTHKPSVALIPAPLGGVSDDMRDDAQQRIERTLNGDTKLTKQVMKLMQEFPAASLPEMVTFQWLQREGTTFDYQGKLFGARAVKGGLVPDFVIATPAGDAVIWQVQGEYWHSQSVKQGRADRVNNLRMLGQVIAGLRIRAVVELWEDDIYNRRPLIYYQAMAGYGLRS